MRITNLILASAVVFAFGAQTFAATPIIDRREANQRARIADGVKDGTLTRPEAHRARAEQRKIRRMDRRANADGTVTVREKARITREQNVASREIYRNKHDGQNRPEADSAK